MVTRRQVLHWGGGVFGAVSALGVSGCVNVPAGGEGAHIWEGEALGAPASIQLFGGNDAQAQNAFARAQGLIAKLSHSFSLYDPGSEISRLNRDGVLPNPSADFIALINHARRVAVLSQGAFDVTVQVLWDAAKRISDETLSPEKSKVLWDQAQRLVGNDGVRVDDRRVWFDRPGMAVTLNGMAQGYITERVARMLDGLGGYSGLVNIGEFQAFGDKHFALGIADPDNPLDVVATVKLRRAGLATSSPRGGYISAQYSHIFSPIGAASSFASASVVHSSATIADGLATAFTLMDEASIRDAARQANATEVILVEAGGGLIRF